LVKRDDFEKNTERKREKEKTLRRAEKKKEESTEKGKRARRYVFLLQKLVFIFIFGIMRFKTLLYPLHKNKITTCIASCTSSPPPCRNTTTITACIQPSPHSFSHQHTSSTKQHTFLNNFFLKLIKIHFLNQNKRNRPSS